MKISKKILLSQAEQAIEDRKILDNANLEDIEIMPALGLLGSLRFLQQLCNEKNKTIQEITPELIINELKNSQKFTFN